MVSIVHTLFFTVIHSETKTSLHPLNLRAAVVSNWAVTYLGMYTVLYVLHSVWLQASGRSNPAWHFDPVCSQKLQIQSNLLEAYEKNSLSTSQQSQSVRKNENPTSTESKFEMHMQFFTGSVQLQSSAWCHQEHPSVALGFRTANI